MVIVLCMTCMTIFHDFAWPFFHDFAWLSNCWDVHPYVLYIIFHDSLSQLLWWYSCMICMILHDDFAWPFFMILHDYLTVEMYTLSFSSSRLHPSSCSVIGSVEDRMSWWPSMTFISILYVILSKFCKASFLKIFHSPHQDCTCPLAL